MSELDEPDEDNLRAIDQLTDWEKEVLRRPPSKSDPERTRVINKLVKIVEKKALRKLRNQGGIDESLW